MPFTPNTFTPLSSEQKDELTKIKEQYKTSLLAIMSDNNQYNAQLDLSLIWEPTEHLPTLYTQLSDLKICLDSFRPISPETLGNRQDMVDVQYTYESNRIEGNSLTLDETQYVIQKGLTIGGKTLNEHLEAINHQEAIHYIRDLSQRPIELSEKELLTIHSLILQGIRDREAGRHRRQAVYVLQSGGKRHEFPDAYLIPKLMEDYFIFFNENKATLHPVEMASHLHQRLVNIHPFIDSNGRTARLMMNLSLLQTGYPITIIDSEMSKKLDYYRILSEYQGVSDSDSQPFELFIAKKVKEALFDYLYFLASAHNPESENKDYIFFKKIQPYLRELYTLHK